MERARRARAPLRLGHRAVDRHLVRRLGAERPRRPGRRRLQLLGRHARTRCARSARPASGSCSCPASATGTHVQVRDPRRRRRLAAEGRPAGHAHARCRPRRASVVFASRYDVGRRRVAGARGARPARHDRADERLRGPPRVLAAGTSATASSPTQLVDVRRRPGLHPRRAHAGRRAPVRRVLGLPGHVATTRRPSRFGNPDDFRYLVDRAAPGRHRRHPRLGPGALPEGRLGAGPLRRHAAVRARRPAARRAPGLGHATSSTSAASEVRNFLVANALYWLRGVPRRRAARRRRRLDALPRLLARSRASGRRTSTADGRTSRRSRSCRRPTRRRTSASPGSSRSPRSPPRGPASPGRRTSAASASASSGTWAGCTTRSATSRNEPVHRQYHHHEMTFSMVYAYTENYVLPISHDEVVHGKGSLLRKMPGDRWQQLRQPAARYLAFMWAHPGKQLLFMGAEIRPGGRVGREPRARLVAARPRRAPRRAATWSATSTAPTAGPPRCGSRTTTRPASSWIDADDADRQRLRLPAHAATDGSHARLHRQLRRPYPTTTTASGCPRPAAWARGPQHRRRDLRRLGRRQPRRGRGGSVLVARSPRLRNRAAPASRNRVAPLDPTELPR